MHAKTWLPLVLTAAIISPAAAQGSSAAGCPSPPTTLEEQDAVMAIVRGHLSRELRAAARAAGVAEPGGIVFAQLPDSSADPARVWSYRSNVPDDAAQAVISRRARLLACWPGRGAVIDVRVDSLAIPESGVEQLSVVRNPQALTRALERFVRRRASDPASPPLFVTVQLRMLVTREGEVAYAYISRGTAPADVNSAIVEAARQLRFRPASIGSVPVDIWVELPVDMRPAGG